MQEIWEFLKLGKTIKELRGAFATLLVTKRSQSCVFCKNAAPLIIGKNANKEWYFSSGDAPLIGSCDEVMYLEDLSLGYASKDELVVYENDILKSLCFSKLSGDKAYAKRRLSFLWKKKL